MKNMEVNTRIQTSIEILSSILCKKDYGTIKIKQEPNEMCEWNTYWVLLFKGGDTRARRCCNATYLEQDSRLIRSCVRDLEHAQRTPQMLAQRSVSCRFF